YTPGVTALASPEALLSALRRIVGEDRLIADRAALGAYAGDSLRGPRGGNGRPSVLPVAAVLPLSTEEVAAVVRAAGQAGTPIVELGGGTGLMGGARSLLPGIVLDLRSMNRVIEIRARDQAVSVQAGAVLEDVGNAIEPYGLIVGHDPWTYPIATVGGTISTNGLGYLGGKYGSMGDQVLGLTVVLAGGEVLRTRAVPKSSTGPGLKHLFIGAEGTMGVITEAVLRVFPSPEKRLLRGYTFPGFDEGYRAIEALIAAGIQPAMVDYGQTYRGSRQSRALVTPADAPGLLFLAFDGLNEEVAALDRRSRQILLEKGGRRLPPSRAQEFWDERHVIAEQIRARRQSGGQEERGHALPASLFDYIHVALPPSAVLPFKTRCERLFTGRGISIAEWGLWHRPELFSVALFRYAETQADVDAFGAAVEDALRLVQDMGGSMEYVHGVGTRLAGLMGREHGYGLQALRALKQVVDPAGLLNPGKLAL
ncbi:MAG TPA: FAD-binding oxidoreductase, partial [Dehalococcoidia bacterium]|nr:FAD-binding oxidoreductase [Dehalococcoidia bacterium]